MIATTASSLVNAEESRPGTSNPRPERQVLVFHPNQNLPNA